MLQFLVFDKSKREPENNVRRELRFRWRFRHLRAAIGASRGDRNHPGVIADREFCSKRH